MRKDVRRATGVAFAAAQKTTKCVHHKAPRNLASSPSAPRGFALFVRSGLCHVREKSGLLLLLCKTCTYSAVLCRYLRKAWPNSALRILSLRRGCVISEMSTFFSAIDVQLTLHDVAVVECEVSGDVKKGTTHSLTSSYLCSIICVFEL